jgi:CubicO group peptidase (beta-lactamase class C family)
VNRPVSRAVPILVVCSLAASMFGGAGNASAAPSATTAAGSQARTIVSIVRQVMDQNHLKSVILSVRVGKHNVITTAIGDSMTGVPATTRMLFRNGAVAISYLTTVLLKLVDKRIVSLDDPISRWLPGLPQSNKITLGMLAASRSGYADYVQSHDFVNALTANVFRAWSRQELIRIGTSQPLLFAPGTNWGYSHTGFVVLGEALEKATGMPIARLVKEYVLDPLGLHDTKTDCTATIQDPLHAFTSERGAYEDSTFWDPSWTLGCGLVMTTNISDLVKSAMAIGSGSLLSKRSHEFQIARTSRLTPPDGPPVFYGMGIFDANSWLYQNPFFSGNAAVMAILPAKNITIAVAATVEPQGDTSVNSSELIYQKIGAYLTPDHAPPQAGG